jgi:hypothetical protein
VLLLLMQGSGAHRRGRSTGALVLPVGAGVSGEPSRTLARDDQQASSTASMTLLQLAPRSTRQVDASGRRAIALLVDPSR